MAKILYRIFQASEKEENDVLRHLISKRIVTCVSDSYRIIVARHGTNRTTLKEILKKL